MKKRIIALLLVLLFSFPVCLVQANEFYVYERPCEIPASVYKEPFMDTPYSTVYAPWLRQIHIKNKASMEKGTDGGEGCQQVRAIAISPVNSDIAYFSTNSCGLYATKNGGKTWYQTNNNYPGFCPRGLVCDPIDENTVYVHCKKADVARSVDGGKTWHRIIASTDSRGDHHPGTLEVDSAGNLYAAMGSGIWKFDRVTQKAVNLTPELGANTADKGPSFYHIAVSKDGNHIYASAVTNSKDVTAVPGLYTSHDGGKTWKISGTDETRTFSTRSVAIHPENPLEVYASGIFTDIATGEKSEPGIYVSNDGANTFEHRQTYYFGNPEEGLETAPKEVYGLEFGPYDAEKGVYPFYYCASNADYNHTISYDYGKTGISLVKPEDALYAGTCRYPAGSEGYTGWLWQAGAFDMNKPGRLLIGCGGVVEYSNGKVTVKNTGFSGASVTDIAVDSQMRPFFVTVDVKGFVHESGSMKNVDELTMNSLINYTKAETFTKAVFDPKNDNHLLAFVGTNNATPDAFGVRHSYDAGKTWEPLAENARVPNGKTYILTYDADDPNTIYTSQSVSHDNGKTWEALDKELLAMSPDCKTWLAYTGTKSSDCELYISYDKGESWEFLIKPGISGFRSCFFDRFDTNIIWVTNTLRVMKIDVAMKKIENYSGKFGYSNFYNMEQNPDVPGHMIVVSSPSAVSEKDFKIAETRDGGETWNPIPGAFGGYLYGIEFINKKVYVCGHQGIVEYDYNTY